MIQSISYDKIASRTQNVPLLLLKTPFHNNSSLSRRSYHVPFYSTRHAFQENYVWKSLLLLWVQNRSKLPFNLTKWTNYHRMDWYLNTLKTFLFGKSYITIFPVTLFNMLLNLNNCMWNNVFVTYGIQEIAVTKTLFLLLNSMWYNISTIRKPCSFGILLCGIYVEFRKHANSPKSGFYISTEEVTLKSLSWLICRSW